MRRTGPFFLTVVLAMAACKSVPKGDATFVTEARPVTSVPAGTAYRVDTARTRIEWIGTSPVNRHHGTFTVREGQLQAVEGAITAGRFVIDMTTLRADDADSINNARLGNHLKSIDFFDVTQYPLATFEITGVQPITNQSKGITGTATHTVTGNLVLKEVTKSISFPARIDAQHNRLVADAAFNMDRGLWGITYNSEGALKNKAIRPMVNVKLHLEAGR